MRLIAVAAFAICLLVTVWSLIRRDRRPGGFSFDDLLADAATGKTSILRVVFIGAFAVCTWLLVFVSFTSRELILPCLTTYVSAFVTPIVVKICGESYVAGKQAAAAAPASAASVVAAAVVENR